MSSIYDTEELKRILVRHNGDVFYLRPSKKRGATYKLLFAKLGSADGTPAATPGTYYGLYSRSCKVDILIPGIMNIPSVESSRIVTIDGLPLVLLLLKLQAWSDHRASDRYDYRQKQYTDISDLTALLAIAVRKQVDVRTAQWLPESFLEAARGRVSRYIVTVPSPQARLWREIGFRVDSGLSDSGGLRQRYLDSNRW